MVEFAILTNFLAALALGALIGLEREYARYKSRGHDYAGIRTFPLISLFGALSAYLGQTISPWILLISISLIGALIVIAYFAANEHTRKQTGVTSEMAGFLAFFIGMLCFYGEITLAVILTIIITVILYSRSLLHHFAEKIKKQEMADTLKFGVIAFVILPLLPNQGYGPYEIFNPYVIWLMVVFISGIGFVGYIAMKWFGEKGVVLAGLLGGLISSTAVTSSFAARSKREVKLFRILALGVVLANGIMLIRILVVVFAINRELWIKLLLPVIILILLVAGFGYVLWRKTKDVKGKVELTSPFTLAPALKFGAFFAVILALVKLADVYLSSNGVYIVSFISGFADVDAIALSLSQLSKTTLDLDTAVNGILIAALTNVGVKGGIAYLFGGKEFGRIVATFYAVLIVIGAGLIWLL
jgi:uncharacterized membrane protein (DUF4010 family)